MCRIEFSIYSGDADALFDLYRTDREISLDLVDFVHYNLKEDILVERFDRSLDDFEAYESNRVIICSKIPSQR